jgi:hypothetical protein
LLLSATERRENRDKVEKKGAGACTESSYGEKKNHTPGSHSKKKKEIEIQTLFKGYMKLIKI